MPGEEKKYSESEAKRQWQKNNTVLVGVKLQRKGDKDLVGYMEEQKKKNSNFSMAMEFKTALREKLDREKTKD